MHHRSTQLARGFCALALTLALPGANAAAGEDADFHFRPFWVEPADRVDAGSGHLVMGIDHERRPATGVSRRTTMPLEATLGLGLGFSTVLAADGAARSVSDDNTRSSAGTRAAKLRYSWRDWNGVNLMLLTGVERMADSRSDTHSAGYSIAVDSALGTIGFGQLWDGKRAEDARGGTRSGINVFRSGLGADEKWALGGEISASRSAGKQQQTHWLLGCGRVVGKGVMADLAIGGTRGEHVSQRLTAGVSWFF